MISASEEGWPLPATPPAERRAKRRTGMQTAVRAARVVARPTCCGSHSRSQRISVPGAHISTSCAADGEEGVDEQSSAEQKASRFELR
eukprot:CAMPEP_0119335530 /NCGR_PEP_ID=MMETSP1333-20130426/89782_1 /TAXON_ID=418940 /ORGANISM="Scyphosphaera apsteinii, Strain RCC1455" /LENGTH=87 /DNA_ID=CAMNT_0007346101 /DNA_START=438 /DNA_END=701 /DNA_ORIENTATION=-